MGSADYNGIPHVMWNLQITFSRYWVILTMEKTGYNLRNSKSDLRLHKERFSYVINN